MTLKLYGDLLSQPARAVVILCLANDISYELILVSLVKREHKLPEFKAINPREQLPVIDDGGFILPESAAILKYLAVSHHVPDHWYPMDLKSRARVDYLLDWYQTNIRQTQAYILKKELYSALWKLPRPQEAEIESAEGTMIASMEFVEDYLLKPEKGPFLLGASELSIADVLFACEYTQTQLLPSAEQEKLLGKKPKTKKWLQTLEQSLAPYYAQAHKTFPELITKVETARNGN
ncbi:hypothetical protein R1sor_019682 [Riccia sorocarpa]|uniref:Glutathione S-transferase n=1 Tax=Riccia sorocarpa TaxID=122646 RepID=A0ABD3IH10_9MARC